ncbi:MAG: hypothetical protein KJZ73_13955 [Pseudorhodoplanes sp.]|nr:hypothetical protein [Pseudorhodoplanes sp.]GIK79929.1 MAG: hypothetical protein BroJett024_10340 [Alphaproteobacteria bacterium]
MTKLHMLNAAMRRALINFPGTGRTHGLPCPQPERVLHTDRSSCVVKIGALGVASPPIA